MFREPTRINFFENWYLRSAQPTSQVAGGAPTRVRARELTHDGAGDLRTRGFRILAVDAVVANHWRGHHDDLPAVGWIGEDFLIAGHVRGEHDLGDRRLNRVAKATAKQGSIFEEKEPCSRRGRTARDHGCGVDGVVLGCC